MKKLNVILLLVGAMMFTQPAVFGSDYLEAMRKAIEAVYHASDITQLQQAVNTLQRIGGAEKSKWEPHYYVAFGYIMMANLEKDTAKKDSYLDHAGTAVELARAIAPGESEIIAIEGFVYMVRISVDPQSRGPELSSKAFEAFSRAGSLNPENPRVSLLMARMKYGSALFFGKSTAEACALVQKSLDQFDNYKSANPLAPAWGKLMADGLRQQCN